MTLRLAGLLAAAALLAGSQPDPQPQMWLNLKRKLNESGADKYFELSVRNAELPPLSGSIVKTLLNDGISKLEIGIEDPSRTDAILVVHHSSWRIKGPLKTGSRLSFKGVAVSFTRNPVVLTFDTSRRDITGLEFQKVEP